MKSFEYPLTRRLMEEADVFERQVKDYLDGRIDGNTFRPMRLWMGIYQELGTYMQRVKVPYGQLRSAQWRVLADCARRYARGWLHLTTRQDIELHWVDIEDAVRIFRAIVPIGLSTREGCGDTVRNVTGDYLAGLATDEVFDIRPYAQMTMDYFLFRAENQKLPRKFKITFSGSEADRGDTCFHEIGYIARLRDGQRGFKVTVAGGLGREPMLAKTLVEFLPESDLNVCTAAILKIFNDHGERANRKKARMKYLMAQWGETRYREEWEKNFRFYKEASGEDFARLRPSTYEGLFAREMPASSGKTPVRGDAGYDLWRQGNVHDQRQPGLKYVEALVKLGDLNSAQCLALADLADRFCGGETRITPWQNLILPCVRAEDLPALYDALLPLGLAKARNATVTDIVSCPGTEFCELSFGSSRTAARQLHKMFDALEDGSDLANIVMDISGCPNSCGRHHVGHIGLIGFNNPNKAGETHMYQILVGGSSGARNELGKRLMGKAVPIEHLPTAVRRITDYYRANRRGTETLIQFFDRVGIEAFKQNIELRDLVS